MVFTRLLQASKAAYGLCCWVRAMESDDRVAKVVEPKRKRLAEAEAELEVRKEGGGVGKWGRGERG